MKKILYAFLLSGITLPVFSQSYKPNVSGDSLAILNGKVDVLKIHLKVLELKIKESEEEKDVEKFRLKLLEAKGNAKASSEVSSRQANNTDANSTINLKDMSKTSKKAKADAEDAQKALEKYNKQISKVEDIRTQIISEERKLSYKKPQLIYDYK